MLPEDFQRLEEAFHAALEQPPERREAFLEQFCPANLRAQVRGMLAMNDSQFLESPALPLPTTIQIGEVIDVYRVERLLGEGGMGAVYEAQRVDAPRRCALKVIRPSLNNLALEERFKSEKDILAQLDHPNIARWIDSRQRDDGLIYLVMDYIEGQPIDKFCTSQRLGVEQRMQLFRQICAAIRYAHRQGVVHRDLKPANILVEVPELGDTQPGTVKLLDFGIAKLVDQGTVSNASSTLVFTPNYASPEQLSGGSVGRASDLYGLGIILYKLLVGQLPFDRSLDNLEELRAKLPTETFLSPSQAILTIDAEQIAQLRGTSRKQLSRQLRDGLDDMVKRLLERDKEKRYPNADELLKAVDHFLNKQSAARLPKLSIASASILGIGLSALLWWQTYGNIITPRMKAIAVLPFDNLDPDPRNAYFGDGVTDEISTRLGKIDGLDVICTEATKYYKNTHKSLREIAKELQVNALIVGSVRRSGNQIRIVTRLIDGTNEKQIWAETFSRPNKDIFVIQSAVATDVAYVLKAKLTPEVAERVAQEPTTSLSAYDFYRKGLEYYSFYRKADNEQAIRLFKKALDLDSNFALAYAGLGDAYAQRVEKFNFSSTWLDQSIIASQKAITLNPELAEGYKSLGLAYLYKGKFSKALEAEKRATTINPNYFAALNNYGFINGYLGRWDEALKAFKKAQTINPTSPYGYTSLGEAYIALGMDNDAEKLLQRAIELQPDTYNGYIKLSYLHLLQGKFDRALTDARKCLVVSPKNEDCHAAAGNAEIHRGNLHSALKYYSKLSTETIAESYSVPVGYLYMRLNRVKDAKKLFVDFLKRAENELLSGSEGIDIPYQMAAIYSILGNREQALIYLHQAYKMGWKNFREARRSPYFSRLHHMLEFQKLMNQIESSFTEIR